ncbi:amidotransferase 1, exosortase A system-associated [Aestuariibacter halophilus]|uniref:asparagine synthase (glutamine-hydrolyzing) n=1 Tax=Fluctibacter halophilus TaxID=226011 RepID=A0ABS8G5B4_9ALTE|nr:XrtA/PEP-CTERM system amidotransferase [Aestuariibacter halophilus]MCC2614859.1 amidotransferase 1, exosortase A system-associated [Aestuariibacter halophilus]
MCGIAGIFDTQGTAPPSESVLNAMNQIQFHRGPDEGSIFIDEKVGLAHRRLSIIDISTGQQPLFNKQRNAAIVFNGEVYNFKSLREELIALGFEFQTHSDTEVILQAYCAWGEKSVERLRGMFAYAIWDFDKQRLFVARDRLGIKPLFWSMLDNGQFIFGSELKVLEQHPQLRRDMDPLAVEDFFAFGYIPEPRTIYSQVHKLEPGYCMSLSFGDKAPTIQQYWRVSFADQLTQSEDDIREEMMARLREAVDIRLLAEVPLGAFLSGGVDSSAIVAMMAEIQGDRPVNTCSIGFDVKNFNETEFAELVVDRYKTDHMVEVVSSDDFDLIDQLAELYDEPYADSSAIPTYRVCELARKRVTVCLSGDGGDEVFAGYRRHKWHMLEEKIRSYVPSGMRKPVFNFLGNYYPKMDWAPKFLRAKSTFQALQRDALAAYLHTMSFVPDARREQLYSSSFKQTLGGYHALEVFKRHANEFDGQDALQLIQYLDMKTYLPGDILTKVDRASMAHSLEVRVPLIDHEFLQWSNKIPSHYKLQGNNGKAIFKKALEPKLPHDVLYRDKMGFGVPISKWFRGPLKDKLRQRILHGKMMDSGYFDPAVLNNMVEGHINGTQENGQMLWAMMMFEAFLQRTQ